MGRSILPVTTQPDFKELHQCFANNIQQFIQAKQFPNIQPFFDNWESALRNLYNRSGVVDAKSLILNANREVFCKTMNFNNFCINLCFDIDFLNTQRTKFKSSKLYLSEFENGALRNSFSLEQPRNVKFNSAAIYITLFPISTSNFLVVDGNHRLAHAKSLGLQTINTLEIPIEIASNSIFGDFEKAYYWLQIECWQLSNSSFGLPIPLEKSFAFWVFR